MEGVRKSLVLGRPFVWGLVFTEGAWNLHDPFVPNPDRGFLHVTRFPGG